MPCAANSEPRGGRSSHPSLVPQVKMGGDSTMVWLDKAGRTAVQLERTKSRSEFKVGWKRGRLGFGLGLGRGHRQAGTVLVCFRPIRPLLMETVLLDYVEATEDAF